jgi:hypothetical protein
MEINVDNDSLYILIVALHQILANKVYLFFLIIKQLMDK